MILVFRLDASLDIGVGHMMRCLNLASELRQQGHAIYFIVKQDPNQLSNEIIKQQFILHVLPASARSQEEDAALTVQIIKNQIAATIDWLIVDHYELDQSWERLCRAIAQKILVIDDLANRPHDCDALLDQTPSRSIDDYKMLVPLQAQLLLGPAYALLKDCFRKLRVQSLARRQQLTTVTKVLVNFGGTDPHQMTEWVINTLLGFESKIHIEVITGFNRDLIQKLKQNNYPSKVTLHHAVTDMAKHYETADLAISAAGSSAFERCCLGLPTLLIIAADNQEKIAADLVEANAALLIGRVGELNAAHFQLLFEQCVANPLFLQKMSAASARLCDGYGARRVASFLQACQKEQTVEIYLKPVTIADADLLLSWQQVPSTRKFARNQNSPTIEEHYRWLRDRLSRTDSFMQLIMYDHIPAGVLRLDRLPQFKETYEISIITAPTHRRLGVARAGLKLLRELYEEFDLYAEVLPENQASHALFRQAGFKYIDGIYLSKAGKISK